MFPLSEHAQLELLTSARLCIKAYLESGKKIICASQDPELSAKSGAFVTLHSAGTLRGCIGMPNSVAPLFETVQQCAISAATMDPRFPPVTLAELSEIQIEISVLSPMVPVADLNDIEVGVHGLLVQDEGHRGLLLPQVATEHHWDRETFIRQVFRKAGLPHEPLGEGAELQRFTAQVFAERTATEKV
jgi:AmmeMemoRadiSam system protein A